LKCLTKQTKQFISLILFIFLLLPVNNDAFAAQPSLADLKVKARNLVSQYVSEEIAVKIFGPAAEYITLPTIPKVSCSSKDDNCDKSQVVKSEDELSKEQKEKYNLAYLRELHKVTRNRKADSNFIVKWMNVMGQGASREGVYRAMVLDSTYAGLENFENPLNDATINFSVTYLKKYVGKTIKSSSLEAINFYTLKRIATERSLEVIDELAKKPVDLARWYAVLSSELATSFPHLWNKNKARQNQSANYHLSWAHKAPSQHLRSEVIIKLHSVFNNLGK
jgi:hypothetical protein